MNYPPEVQWIKKNKDFLNLKAVAEAIGVPVKNLWNYCNDVHSLNETWWAAAINWVATLSATDPVINNKQKKEVAKIKPSKQCEPARTAKVSSFLESRRKSKQGLK